MCGWACAYCGDIIGRTGEDVEHYRPKNHYWWLAYSLDNYFSSCGPCNSRKGAKFPTGAQASGPESDLDDEQRLLLDPAADDVEAILRIEINGPERAQYRLVVGVDLTPGQLAQAEETIRFFHLEDDVELVRARVDAISTAMRELTSDDQDVRKHARRKMSRYERFGSAIRSVVAQENPSLLTTPEEDLRWFFDEQIRVLDLLDHVSRVDEKVRRITLFALASLWRHPPCLTPAEVEQWLVDANRKDDVEPSYLSLAAPPSPPGR